MADIPRITDGVVAWLQKHPDAPNEVIDFANKMKAAKVKFLAPVSPQAAGNVLIESDQNIIIVIPVAFTSPQANVATYSATAGVSYSQSDTQALMDQVAALTTRLNSLLQQLRNNGQNPG